MKDKVLKNAGNYGGHRGGHMIKPAE